MSKLVLVLNCGSSSLKFAIINPVTEEEFLTGLAECLTLDDARIKWKLNGKHDASLGANANHKDALNFIVDTILASSPELKSSIAAVGHRVVHGGEKFSESVLLDSAILDVVRSCSVLAPLHNPANVIGIEVAQTTFPQLKNVAVFDTAFHQTMPDTSYLYAIPYSLYKEHGIRRYGMHGTSHSFITQMMAKRLNKPLESLNIISCHLGNGSSVCAVRNGKSVDTSMGLTPLEGLVMGTRSGDIDPAIIFHLHDALGYSVSDINDLLTKKSGLLGLTETTSDCRYVEDNYQTDDGAKRAFDITCQRLAKYIAAYATELDGRLDGIAFTGGIGENSAPIRAEVIRRLAILGFKLDEDANRKNCFGKEGIITTEDSIIAMVVSTNEELVIAQETARIAQL